MSKEFLSHKENYSKEITNFITSNEQLADTTQRRDYFCRMTEADFIDLLEQIASLVRTGNPSSRQHLDGDKVSLLFHEVPDQREKEELLKSTWKTAKLFLEDQTIPDQDALDYAMLTVAGGVLYTHPFADGNGRTTRALTYMMSKGSNDPEHLEKILAESEGGGLWYVAPESLRFGSPQSFGGNQPKEIHWEDSMAGEGMDALGGIITNSGFRNKIIRSFIENHGEEISSQIKASMIESDSGEFEIDGEEFIKRLVRDPESGMTDAKELIDLYRKARADYIQGFLDMMKSNSLINPRESSLELGVDIDSEDYHGSEYRKSVIVKSRREFSKRSQNGMVFPRDRALIEFKSHSAAY